MTRGTLQTIFHSKAYDELVRLGLTDESERLVRSTFPDQTGMLVVEQVIPDSPADGKLEPGDILLRINGELVTEFVPLAAILDDTVGEDIEDQILLGDGAGGWFETEEAGFPIAAIADGRNDSTTSARNNSPAINQPRLAWCSRSGQPSRLRSATAPSSIS